VLTENSVRSENTGVPTIREIMVAITMKIPFSGFHQCNVVTLRSKLATISIRQGQAQIERLSGLVDGMRVDPKLVALSFDVGG
jgi:hypothetical protein